MKLYQAVYQPVGRTGLRTYHPVVYRTQEEVEKFLQYFLDNTQGYTLCYEGWFEVLTVHEEIK